MRIIQLINSVVFKVSLNSKRKSTTKAELASLIAGKTLEELTPEEIKKIGDVRSFLGTKPTLEYWKLYKTYANFNPHYVA